MCADRWAGFVKSSNMASSQIFLDQAYLIPRILVWLLLFVVATVDAYRHKTVRSRGWQLNRAILVVIFSYILQDIFLTVYTFQDTSVRNATANRIFEVYIFFTDLADSLFIVSFTCYMIQPWISF